LKHGSSSSTRAPGFDARGDDANRADTVDGVATLTGISPLLLVADLDRAVAFYRDALGFNCDVYGEPADFAVASRDRAVILLRLAPPNGDRVVPNWQIADNAVDAYIRVDDADAIYEEVQQRGARIDYTIYDAPHGFREFGVQDPDGHDIAFGQPL
jgi:predicted enzyme related to lactoylglutathione lyase